MKDYGMQTMVYINNRGIKLIILALLVISISMSHFLIPTVPPAMHQAHIILRKLYFLPLVVAAAWFGLRGAVYTTAVITIAFTGHIFLDWPDEYMEQANQIGELAGFWVIGLVAGSLFDHRMVLMERLVKADEDTILALVSALDMREKNTRLHSQRVRDYTLLLADRFGLKRKEKRAIALGALLHDMGKIAVPDHILLKPDKLSEDELEEMQKHPEEGYRLLQRIDFLKEAADIVYSHHEYFDGTGYPRKLAGADISLGARLFMVADVYDALTSQRPYRTPMSHEEAMAVIQQKSGTHFDPAVVDVFFNIKPTEWAAIQERYASA